jgi:hypothetical protein
MIATIRDKILDYRGIDSVPMVVVGNKTDLAGQRCVRKFTFQLQKLIFELRNVQTSGRI